MMRRLPAALVVAHPGHEVCVYGWLESARPRLFILTDGSGRNGQSRLKSAAALLAELGLQPGSIFGRFTDRNFYSAVIAQDTELFLSLARELAAAFVREEITSVAGDAAEGYNSTHDLCRALINAAVVMAQRSSGREIANYDFTVVGQPGTCPENLRADALWRRLEESVFQRKLAATREHYPELLAEIEETLQGMKQGPRVECLRPARSDELLEEQALPFYERHGQAQVAAGHYAQVIRYREHVRPLMEALSQASQTYQASRGHRA
jgi:hypothetical protein